MYGRGWEDVDKSICLEHVLDPSIRASIDAADRSDCSFCDRSGDDPFAVDLQAVMEAFMPTFWQFYGRYEDSPTFSGVTLETEDTDIAVADVGEGVFESEVEEAVQAAIVQAIIETEVSSWDPAMSTTMLAMEWDRFDRVTRYGARFVMTAEAPGRSPLAQVHGLLDELVQYVDGPHHLVHTVSSDRIYRGRLLRDRDDPFDTPEKLGAPAARDAASGRMSPAGIRMFYGAGDVSTAVAEIAVHSVQAYAQVAAWTPTRELRILDLSDAPKLPSPFDPKNWTAYRRLRFLQEFANAIARPVVPDGRQHSEYAPTQILTEYLRFVPTTPIDGIAYPSAHTGGKNYAIFIDSTELHDATAGQSPLKIDRSTMSDIYRVDRTVTATIDN